MTCTESGTETSESGFREHLAPSHPADAPSPSVSWQTTQVWRAFSPFWDTLRSDVGENFRVDRCEEWLHRDDLCPFGEDTSGIKGLRPRSWSGLPLWGAVKTPQLGEPQRRNSNALRNPRFIPKHVFNNPSWLPDPGGKNVKEVKF